MEVARLWAIATAACRDAKNGKSFVAEAERICGVKIDILSGKREAELSALGVVSGFHRPDGIVGDLGGGSLELTEVHGHRVRHRLHASARRAGAAGHLRRSRSRRRRRSSRKAARGCACCSSRRQGPHLLRHRRHLARAGAAAHVADRLSAPCDARLRDAGEGGVRVLQPGAPRRSRDALADRGGDRRSPSAARLCRAGARESGATSPSRRTS